MFLIFHAIPADRQFLYYTTKECPTTVTNSGTCANGQLCSHVLQHHKYYYQLLYYQKLDDSAATLGIPRLFCVVYRINSGNTHVSENP